MGKTRKHPKTDYEIWKGVRRDWGDIKPYTRIEESEKAYSRKRDRDRERKRKMKYFDEEEF